MRWAVNAELCRSNQAARRSHLGFVSAAVFPSKSSSTVSTVCRKALGPEFLLSISRARASMAFASGLRFISLRRRAYYCIDRANKTVFRENRIVAVPELGPAGEKLPEEINHGSYHDVSPSVSADGKTMVFAVEHGSSWDIRLRNLESNSEHSVVTKLRSRVSPDPVMRPDGSEIAFVSEQATRRNLDRGETGRSA